MIPGWAVAAALLYLASRDDQATAATGATARQGGSMGETRIYSGRLLTIRQRNMADLIVSAARSAGMNPSFMLALAVTESSLDPSAMGDDGRSTGLFQLLLSTARLTNPTVTASGLLDPDINAWTAMREMRRVMLAYPGHTYGDYAEAWTLGPAGKFVQGRSNPGKLVRMNNAARDLALTLNLNEVAE